MSSQIFPISSIQKNLKMCKYISIFSFPFRFLICTILISVFCNHYNVFYQGCQRHSYWPINWFLFVVIIEYFLELWGWPLPSFWSIFFSWTSWLCILWVFFLPLGYSFLVSFAEYTPPHFLSMLDFSVLDINSISPKDFIWSHGSILMPSKIMF